jgi:hypothetical protein
MKRGKRKCSSCKKNRHSVFFCEFVRKTFRHYRDIIRSMRVRNELRTIVAIRLGLCICRRYFFLIIRISDNFKSRLSLFSSCAFSFGWKLQNFPHCNCCTALVR